MTTDLLKIPRAKVTYAREQLNGLEMEFQRFSESKPYTLREEQNLETGERILVYYPNAPIPDNWTIVAGNIFHGLRSALNNAVSELTIREHGNTLPKTDFPIFDNPTVFSLMKKDGSAPASNSGLFQIRGLSQKTQTVIESLQPYNITATDQVSILWMLHELNIADKHHDGLFSRQMANSTELVLVNDVPHFVHWGPVLGVNLDERAVIAVLQTSEPLDDSKVYMDGDVAIEILFDQRCCPSFKKQERVVKMTSAIINGVEAVLNHLETSLD